MAPAPAERGVVARLGAPLLVVLTVAVMAWGAAQGLKGATAAAAGVFVIVAVVASLAVNGRRLALEPAARFRANLSLVAWIYAWGAAALLAAYPASGLNWYHWWQYGFAMALIAGGLWLLGGARAWGGARNRPPPPVLVVGLTAAHGAAALAGLVWLVTSGKIASSRGDWLSNVVFLAGGVAVVVLSIAALWREHVGRKSSAGQQGAG